jgi:hypothetical protein
MSVCSIYLTCVCIWDKIFRNASTKRKPNQDTQIPLMGMEKLGTKGPTFIATITLRTKFSLSLTLETWILISFGSWRNYKKNRRKTFDEVESPSGASKALISQNLTEYPIFLDGPAKKQQAKLVRRW